MSKSSMEMIQMKRFSLIAIALLLISSAFAQRMYDGSGHQIGRVWHSPKSVDK
jgi:hypothetical protein